MNANVDISGIEIQSLSDYAYLEQKVKDYHDSVVEALLRLSHRNPDKYNLSMFHINYDANYVWTTGTITLSVTTLNVLYTYLGGNKAWAEIEHAEHKKEIDAFKRKIKKEGL